MSALYIVAAMLLMLLAVAVFATQNIQAVAVNLLFWHFTAPLGVIVLAATAVGAVLVALFGLVRQVGLSLRIHDTRGRLRRTEGDLTTTRTELERARAELEQGRTALSEKEQDLIALRAQLAAVQNELEEARKRAATTAGAGAAGQGGSPNGSGSRQG